MDSTIDPPIETEKVNVTTRGKEDTMTDFDFDDFDDKTSGWITDGSLYMPCAQFAESLEPGFYTGGVGMNGPFIKKKNLVTDELITIDNDTPRKVLNGLEKFWNNKQKFRDLGVIWKRGVLLYGPPGTGKTAICSLIAEMAINKGAIVLSSRTPVQELSEVLETIRTIQPETPIVVLIEDIDQILMRGGEHELLQVLDGDQQVDNTVFIATTNYPNLIDNRIIKRPSRFDEIIEICPTKNKKIRKEFIRQKSVNIPESELDTWTEKSEDMSFAHIKEMIILHECFDKTLDDAKNQITEMMQNEFEDYNND